MKKGLDYLISDDALGEHGLVKMRGGDWLNCLSGVGKNGVDESVMVSCQLVMCLGYLSEILKKVGREKEDEKYEKSAYKLINTINKAAYNGKFTMRYSRTTVRNCCRKRTRTAKKGYTFRRTPTP